MELKERGPNGLANVGLTCFFNSSIQLFNAVKPFRESIMKSPSTDPLILGLQEIFRGINSAEGIQRNRLEELLKNTIFPPLSWDLFRIDKQADVFQFILSFFDVLEKKG